MKKQLPKGTCSSCWGKGYYTQMSGEIRYPDFIGDKKTETGPEIHKIPCPRCNGTGKDLSPQIEDIKAQCTECKRKFYTWLSDSNECPDCEGEMMFFDCLQIEDWETEYSKLPEPSIFPAALENHHKIIKNFIRNLLSSTHNTVTKKITGVLRQIGTVKNDEEMAKVIEIINKIN